MPELELVLGIIEGRIDFAVLQHRFEHLVFGRIYRLVKNRPDAEDLTQNVFVRVFEWLDRFDPKRASFRTWLYEITTSIVVNYFRAKRRAPQSLDAMPESAAPSVAGPDELHEANARQAQLLQSFEQLDPLDRGVMIGFHVRNLSWKEIAAENNCTERHARYRAGVALKKLRESL